MYHAEDTTYCLMVSLNDDLSQLSFECGAEHANACETHTNPVGTQSWIVFSPVFLYCSVGLRRLC
jgi:hypothetical protein